jgi:predicted O-methyltransferase YrrM
MNLDGGRIIDESNGLIFPWYTHPFLKLLNSWNVSNWKVFEYGGGDSTLWWRNKCREIISIDSNLEWSTNIGAKFINNKDLFINSPLDYIKDEKFDCVIIDCEPVSWRDECTPAALNSLKDGGILIIDNYKQKTVDLENWPITDNITINMTNKIFQQPGHQDWKTSYWVK